MSDQGILQRLRKLVGRDCRYLGKNRRLVEVLADDGFLVLETRELLPPIQRDQYGQAAYRGNDLTQIPIFGPDGASFSEEMMDLFTALSAGAQTKDLNRT